MNRSGNRVSTYLARKTQLPLLASRQKSEIRGSVESEFYQRCFNQSSLLKRWQVRLFQLNLADDLLEIFCENSLNIFSPWSKSAHEQSTHRGKRRFAAQNPRHSSSSLDPWLRRWTESLPSLCHGVFATKPPVKCFCRSRYKESIST